MSTALEPRPSSHLDTIPASAPDVIGAADGTLTESAQRRIVEAKAANTRRAYARQWRQFEAWCDQHGRVALPATPETLASYVGHLADLGRSTSTIRQAIATVRAVHAAEGYDKHPSTKAALDVLTAYRREQAQAGRQPKEAPPITFRRLRAMLDCLDDSPAGRRDRAMLTLGLAIMARRSELASLQISDVSFVDEGLVVLIRVSKTDQQGEGARVKVLAGQRPESDPVRSVRTWLNTLSDQGITEGPLFRRVNRWGQIGGGLSTHTINNRIRALAEQAGLPDAHLYTAHGLRSGGATELATAGVPEARIAEQGRWIKGSTQLPKYIREVDGWRDNPWRGVWQ